MKKQLLIRIGSAEPIVIDLKENEAIDLHVSNNATKFFGPEEPATTFRASGHRWEEKDYFTFDWGGRELKLGDNVTIDIVMGDLPATPVRAEDKFIEPERDCSFCETPTSQVKHLIEATHVTRICDECVATCQGSSVKGKARVQPNKALQRSGESSWPHRARNGLRTRRCAVAVWPAAELHRYAAA